jgi:glycosyltransferase involved in cell wall biosynthesis
MGVISNRAGFRINMEMFCSTIIPTIGRNTLSRAVCSVLDQDFTEAGFEVIVVNDSGRPLPEAEWQFSDQVQIINTNRRERSVARNTGAAIAEGKYLHFLDDDDILLPGALSAFWSLDQTCEADWLLGGWRTVDNNGDLVEEFNPPLKGNIFALLVAGEGLPFQTSLVSTKKFFEAGAFDPTIIGVEDRDLGRRIALFGEIAYIETIAAEIRIGQQGSTTNWGILAEDDRWGREKALGSPNAFLRLRRSADSNYWRGRVTRAYLASMAWNFTRKNWLISLSRLLASISFSGMSILDKDYWEGLRTKIK